MIGPVFNEKHVVLDMPGTLEVATRARMQAGVVDAMAIINYERHDAHYEFEGGRVVVTITFRWYNPHPARAEAVAAARESS